MYQGQDGQWYEDDGSPAQNPPDSGGSPAPPVGQAAGYGGEDDQAAQGFIRDWLNGHPVPGADPNAFMAQYRTQRGMYGHDQALLESLRGLGWDQWAPQKTDTGGGGNPPPSGDGGGGSATLGDLFTPFNRQAPNFTYDKPPAFAFEDYAPTSADDVYKDPSYALRRDEGQRGLETSKASEGLYRTGGTLNDILKYNQAFASGEFSNVDARRKADYGLRRANAADTYNTNYKTQFVDPWTLNTEQGWKSFLTDLNTFQTDRQFKYNTLADQQRIGLQAAQG